MSGNKRKYKYLVKITNLSTKYEQALIISLSCTLGGVMPRCIFLILASTIGSSHLSFADAVDKTIAPQEIMCLREGCKLWDTERGDCGLKYPSTIPVSQELPVSNETKIILGFHTDDPPFPSEPE